jgi:hypothetical protein
MCIFCTDFGSRQHEGVATKAHSETGAGLNSRIMSKNMQVNNLLLRIISSLKIDYHPTGQALICHSCFIERELQPTCTFAETRSTAHKKNKQE